MSRQVGVADDADDDGRGDHADSRDEPAGGDGCGWVRQLVSATAVCRSPAYQPSAVLAAMIFVRASQMQPTSAVTSSSRIILGSHRDPDPRKMIAAAAQQTATAADLQ